MRRKNRKWVAMAAAVYLFIMWSAYRWGVAQRPTDGSILDHIEREAVRKGAEERAKAAAAGPQPTGESRLNAAGPVFVAARYDATHVVFMVAAQTESRFAASSHFSRAANKIPEPAKAAAPLAGFQELWEPDSQAVHFFPEIVQKTHPGEQWSLNVSPDTTIPVVIDRAVVAPTGCSLAMGFLATVPSEQQAAFGASAQDYFAVRRRAVESNDPSAASHIAELGGWSPSPTAAKQIEQQLAERMKREVAKIDDRLIANAGSPGSMGGELPAARAQPRLKEWIHVDRGLMRGEGTLDYDLRAFRLTPDGAPRLFVRARWKLANAPVFLMTAWFKADSFKADSVKADSVKADSVKAETVRANSVRAESVAAEMSHPKASGTSSPNTSQNAASLPLNSPLGELAPVLLSADASWSLAMREGEATGSLGDRLDFQTILNEFDADHDGWAELLIHSDQGDATTIVLYLYSDMGLAPLKTPLRRDSVSPESCVDP